MITYYRQKGIRKPGKTKQELKDYFVKEADGIVNMIVKKA
tara:strand:+ start:4986 stop:5105 length:120 start_codon:yes stop_codon:yes gene_type:complete